MSQSALRPEDALRAKLPAFQLKVDRALEVVSRARRIGRIGISFSGGKDSTVLLHLVRRVDPEAPAAFFDSGAELQSTYEIVRHYGVETIHPRLTFQEMARYSGKWGYADPVDPGCPFNFGTVLMDEPGETFVVKHRLRVSAMGLRGEESAGRWMNAAARGELYQGSDRTWYLCPLAYWTVDDVWAYISHHQLKYNAAYDALDACGVPRGQQRIATILGDRAAQYGKYALLKRIELETFNRLAAEFPELRSYG